MLEGREDRNKLRNVVDKAAKKKVLTKEEIGFIVILIERFRSDIERKIKQLHLLQGEIAQLRNNEQIIMNLVENMIAAAERQMARQTTMDKIKGMREEKSESEEEKSSFDEDGEEPTKEDS